jgi:hypothetical protein
VSRRFKASTWRCGGGAKCLPRPAASWCQRVNEKAEGGTTFPSAHDDIEPGPHWQPAHFGPVSPDRPPHCQWQPLSLLPVPLATSRCRARGQARGHWQRSQPGAPSTHGPLPVPVESGAGGPCQWPRASHWQRWQPHCTPDLAGAQVQVAARPGPVQPLANAHGAAVTVPCSPTRSRARATRPPRRAPSESGPRLVNARGTGTNWQWPASGRAGVPGRRARGPSRRRGTACGQSWLQIAT